MSISPSSGRPTSCFDHELAASAAACGPLSLAKYLNNCNDPRFFVLTESDIIIPDPPRTPDDGLNSYEDACWLDEAEHQRVEARADDPAMTVLKSAAIENRVAKLMNFLLVADPEHEFTKNTKRRVLNWNKQQPPEASITPVHDIPSMTD